MSTPAGIMSASTKTTSPRTNSAAPNSVSYTDCFFGSMSFAQTHSHRASNPSRTRPAPAKKSTKDDWPGPTNAFSGEARTSGAVVWAWTSVAPRVWKTLYGRSVKHKR